MSSNPSDFEYPSPAACSEPHTYADLIVDYLCQIGIEYVFGVPGGAIEPFFDALSRRSRNNESNPLGLPRRKILSRKFGRKTPPLQLVVARHEAGAAFMADGYARETGKLGVCCATTGPGSTNLITGVASACADKIPMLVITAQTALPCFGKQGLQESSSDAIDTVAMFSHCTRYSSLVSHPDQLERKLLTALVSAHHRPCGPVHLSIPIDIQRLQMETETAAVDVAIQFRQTDAIDTQHFDALCQAVIQSHKIVLLLGNDCRGATSSIERFAESVGAAIITTPAGKGSIDSYHSLYRGVFGFAGHESARNVLLDSEVDLVLAIGTSLDELSTSGWDQTLLNDKLIHVDPTTENFIYSPMARLHIFGSLSMIFSELNTVVTRCKENDGNVFYLDQIFPDRKPTSEKQGADKTPSKSTRHFGMPKYLALHEVEKCLSNDTPIKPQRLMFELSRRFPNNTRFLSDAGNSWAWTTHYLNLKSNGCYRIGMGYGAMAWAIGAAIGTALASRNAPVVCITGDGSFLMSGQELTVAVEHKLPIIFVILNDQSLGMVKHGQRLAGAEKIGFELPPVDFASIARAMGATAHTITKPEDFDILDSWSMCNAETPTLLDVHIDPEEVPPMKARMKVLNTNQT